MDVVPDRDKHVPLPSDVTVQVKYCSNLDQHYAMALDDNKETQYGSDSSSSITLVISITNSTLV